MVDDDVRMEATPLPPSSCDTAAATGEYPFVASTTPGEYNYATMCTTDQLYTSRKSELKVGRYEVVWHSA